MKLSNTLVWTMADAFVTAHSSSQHINAMQNRRLNDVVHHARTSSPLYRHLYQGVSQQIENIAQLPGVDKATLMGSFDDWVTDPEVRLQDLKVNFLSNLDRVGDLYLGKYMVMTTSGTTGEPAILLQDDKSWHVINVLGRTRPQAIVTRINLVQLARRGTRTAALFATGGHYGAAALTERVRRISPLIAERTRVISVLRPIDEIVAELNSFNPTLISGYPSIISLLAAEQRSGRLRITPLHILCAGELLTPSARQEINEVFNCPLTEGYAATEVPALAMQCAENRFHVNADWYVLEAVDENHHPVPAGVESATVLVTNLANRVQPIIRYDLGDRVTLFPDKCSCGSLLPSLSVEGRTNDVLKLEGTDEQQVSILPLALGSVIEETPGVHRFQVVGHNPREILIRLDVDAGFEKLKVEHDVSDRVKGYLDSLGVRPLNIIHDSVRPQQDQGSGKLRQVIRG